MAKIFIEKKEIKFKVQENIESTSFEVVDGSYVEDTKLNRKYISDIYSYLDFNALFAMENLFDEYYIKVILYNDERKLGYDLISLPSSLDISIKRISPKNFIVLGVNNNQESQGQASFCSLQNDGSVNESTINFNYLNQYKVIQKKYFLLNYIETLDNADYRNTSSDESNTTNSAETENVEKSAESSLGTQSHSAGSKVYINTIGVYRDDGSIQRILYEERLNIKRELVCEMDNENIIIFYKDDGSVIKKIPIIEVIL